MSGVDIIKIPYLIIWQSWLPWLFSQGQDSVPSSSLFFYMGTWSMAPKPTLTQLWACGLGTNWPASLNCCREEGRDILNSDLCGQWSLELVPTGCFWENDTPQVTCPGWQCFLCLTSNIYALIVFLAESGISQRKRTKSEKGSFLKFPTVDTWSRVLRLHAHVWGRCKCSASNKGPLWSWLACWANTCFSWSCIRSATIPWTYSPWQVQRNRLLKQICMALFSTG